MATDAAIRGLEARDGSPVVAAVQSIIDRSREHFIDDARPRGLYQSLSTSDFEEIYRGKGNNDDDTPLEHVVEEAGSLALFAVTLGDGISDHITTLFNAGELLAPHLATLHNITFFQRIMREMRKAIRDDRFSEWHSAFLMKLRENDRGD